jgi:hypothetical protein
MIRTAAAVLLILGLALPSFARGGADGVRSGSGTSRSDSSGGGGRGGSSNSGGGSRSGSGNSGSGASRRDSPGRTGSERDASPKADRDTGRSEKGGSGSEKDGPKADRDGTKSDKGGSKAEKDRSRLHGSSGDKEGSRRTGPSDRGRDDTDLDPHRKLVRDRGGDRRDNRPRGGWFGRPGYYFNPFGYDPYYGNLEASDESRPTKGGDNVQLRVKPDDAQVYVNGLLYSNRGRARFGLPIGPWKIEIRAAGYVSQTIELNVEQGIRYTIERKLEKDRGVSPDGRPLPTEDLNDRGDR